MSAVAQIVSRKGAVLLSDGVAFRLPETAIEDEPHRDELEIYAEDHSKVTKINHRVGILWIGTHVPDIQDNLKAIMGQANATTPLEVANELSTRLIEWHEGKEHLLEQENYNIVTCVTGFSNGFPFGHNIISAEGFEIKSVPLAEEGTDATCMVPFIETSQTPFEKLCKKHMNEEEYAHVWAKRAFTEMIRDYEAQGKVVGGEIFSVVLWP